MLNWLGTVLVINKFYGKLTNYQSSSASFTIPINFWNDQSFSFDLLPFLEHETPDQGKATSRADGSTKWSPTVRSMALASFMPSFWPYFIINWLGIVPLINKVYRKVMNCQIGLDPFAVAIKMWDYRSFGDALLTLLKSETPDQGKEPSRVTESTKLFLTVRSMSLAPCMLRFWPYYTLDCLGTVPVKNNVYRKLANSQSGLACFNTGIKM